MRSLIACASRSSLDGRNSAKLRRSPFTEYCRAGNVTFLPPSRRSQTEKPINLRPLSGPASASKITSASASFPAGLPFSFGMIFTDTSSPVCSDIHVLRRRRGPGATAPVTFAWVDVDACEQGETYGPYGAYASTKLVGAVMAVPRAGRQSAH